MKVKFELPTGMEMKNLKQTATGLEWDVIALRGQNAVSAGYVTIQGATGRESKAVLRVNVKNGSVQAVKPQLLEQAQVYFDLSPEQAAQRKALRQKNLPSVKAKEAAAAKSS